MEQTVTNERLAVQQQLTSIYSNRINQFDWSLDHQLNHPNQQQFDVHTRCSSSVETRISGIVIMESDSLLFPRITSQPSVVKSNPKLLSLEYSQKLYDQAAEEYQKIAELSDDKKVQISALLGVARCYKKQGDTTKAISTYENIIHSIHFSDSTEDIGNAIIALAKLYVSQKKTSDNGRLTELLKMVRWDISSDMRMFMVHNQLKIVKKAEQLSSIEIDSLSSYLENIIQFEHTSLAYQSHISDSLIAEQENLSSVDSLYYLCKKELSFTVLKLLSPKRLTKLLNQHLKQLNDPNLTFRLIDITGDILDSSHINEQPPIYTLSLSEFGYGDISMEFYLKESTLFSSDVKNKAALNIWIGILTILFIFITGSAATYLYIHHSNLNKLKNNFLSTVTHELKTPIASCRVLVDTLLDNKVTDPDIVREYHDLIAQENLRLSRLVDTFLTFSRMDRNNKSFHKQIFQIDEVLRVAIDSLRVKLNQSNCKFSYEPLENTPLLYGNVDAIITVVTNILDNAIKYSGHKKEISIRCTSDNLNVQFSIIDNGIGIAQKEQKKIFSKFYQVNQKLSRTAEGCGLGLSIVQYIVKAHSGKITVFSKEKSGSTFTVSLPIHKEQL